MFALRKAHDLLRGAAELHEGDNEFDTFDKCMQYQLLKHTGNFSSGYSDPWVTRLASESMVQF